MNRFDDENRIISDFQQVEDNSVFFVVESKEAENIYQQIHSTELWKNWTNSSGKSDPPPDFYADKYTLMMDVMRIDDHAFIDSKGKVQNPTNAGESKLYKELKDAGILQLFPNADVFINAKTVLPTEQDHNYSFYKENFKRVLSEHIKKIPLYKNNHQGYKTIFFILDESSAYIECQGEKPDMDKMQENDKIKALPHFFFWDSSFIEVFKDKQIDFLIWYAPFKLLRSDKGIIDLPKVAIFDCRILSNADLQSYNSAQMCSVEL